MVADVVQKIKGGLVVSCQAEQGSPFFQPESMARFAKAAEIGGAVSIRAKEPDIRAIKQMEGFEVYITPRFEDAERIAAAGAEVIALDCTPRARPGGVTMEELVGRIKSELKLPVMADIATLQEAMAAEKAGADIVATTMSGYTAYSPKRDTPDFDLLEAIIRAVAVPVIAEGHIHTIAEAQACFALGAWAIVIGTAITRPVELTERFARGISGG